VLSREGGGARRPCSTGIFAPAEMAELLVLGTVLVHCPESLLSTVLVQRPEFWGDKNSLLCPIGKVLREFSPHVRANLGNDLHRPEDGLEALASGSMAEQAIAAHRWAETKNHLEVYVR
jgi:hypothetical protein